MDESAFDDFKEIEDSIPEIDATSRPVSASSKGSGELEAANTYSRHGNRPSSARPQSAAARRQQTGGMSPNARPMTSGGFDPLGGDNEDPNDKKGGGPPGSANAELGSAGALPSSSTSRARVLAQQREMLMKRRAQNMNDGMMRSNVGPTGDEGNQMTAPPKQFSAPRNLEADPFGSNPKWGGGGESERPGTSQSPQVTNGSARPGQAWGDDNDRGAPSRSSNKSPPRTAEPNRGVDREYSSRGGGQDEWRNPSQRYGSERDSRDFDRGMDRQDSRRADNYDRRNSRDPYSSRDYGDRGGYNTRDNYDDPRSGRGDYGRMDSRGGSGGSGGAWMTLGQAVGGTGTRTAPPALTAMAAGMGMIEIRDMIAIEVMTGTEDMTVIEDMTTETGAMIAAMIETEIDAGRLPLAAGMEVMMMGIRMIVGEGMMIEGT